mgnify:FL=1
MRNIKRLEAHVGVHVRNVVKNSVDDVRDKVSMVFHDGCVFISAPDMELDIIVGMGDIKQMYAYKETPNTSAKSSTTKTDKKE